MDTENPFHRAFWFLWGYEEHLSYLDMGAHSLSKSLFQHALATMTTSLA